MSQEKPLSSSPFSALTYQEQQDRWLEWRSRQLDYQPGPLMQEAPSQPIAPSPPPLKLPFARDAAPTRHRELDQVLARHSQAARRVSAFQPTSAIQSGR